MNLTQPVSAFRPELHIYNDVTQEMDRVMEINGLDSRTASFKTTYFHSTSQAA